MLKTETRIVVNISVEGLHCWPGAKKLLPTVAFLGDAHRHHFKFRIEKKVNHDDRDREIIMFGREVKDWLRKEYWSTANQLCVFGTQSCEMLALEVLKKFDVEVVECLEDGENGAIVYKS